MPGSGPSPRKCSADFKMRHRKSAPLLTVNGERQPVHMAAAVSIASITALAANTASIAPIKATEASLRPYIIVGDGIPASLTGTSGRAERGRAIITNRQVGLCLLCHRGPFPEEKLQGTLAPDLAGTGARWSEAQLRLRIVDPTRINPDTIMPAYYRVEGLTRAADAFRGKPILSAEQIEDVVAYLSSLRE
jgi:sulfur-oxidizing protein SoxX